MSGLNDLLKQYGSNMSSKLFTCTIARIESIEGLTITKAQPLLGEGTPLINLPIAYTPREVISGGSCNCSLSEPQYIPGDLVLVVFAHADIDNALSGGSNPLTDRKHSLTDGIVVGKIGG